MRFVIFREYRDNMLPNKRTVIIVGGGIIGLATAFTLTRRRTDLNIVVVEKEKQVGLHQTGRNSGVLHCGLYYKPGSQKATLSVRGIRRMVEFCQEHRIAHRICGKLVVATNPMEDTRLERLWSNGLANGLRGLRRLRPDEIKQIEPYAGGTSALHVPEEGIVDYRAVAEKMRSLVEESGNTVKTSCAVQGLEQENSRWLLRTNQGTLVADHVVNCAGLHCDRISEAAGEKRVSRIVPFRGEYFKIRPEREYLIKNLIYPVPDPQFPFLGVHFTRQIGGGVEAGPNAVLAFSREGYRFCDVSFRDVADYVAFRGFWRFLWRHRQMCLSQLFQSLSKRRFCRELRRLVVDIRPRDLVSGGAGVRAQAMFCSGELVEDFQIIARQRICHLLNAPSPAATAALAIAEEVCEQSGLVA